MNCYGQLQKTTFRLPLPRPFPPKSGAAATAAAISRRRRRSSRRGSPCPFCRSLQVSSASKAKRRQCGGVISSAATAVSLSSGGNPMLATNPSLLFFCLSGGGLP